MLHARVSPRFLLAWLSDGAIVAVCLFWDTPYTLQDRIRLLDNFYL